MLSRLVPDELFKVFPRGRSPGAWLRAALRRSLCVARYAVRMLETGVIGLMCAGRSGRAAITVIKTTSVPSRCPDTFTDSRLSSLARGWRVG